MKKSYRNVGISLFSALLLMVAFFAATPAANAQEALCELDWNRDGVVDGADYREDHADGTYSGFYVDVYRHVYVAKGLHVTRPNPDLDWNGDGVIDMDDAGGPTSYDFDDFYTQLYVYINWYLRGYHQVYNQYYPKSDCNQPYADAPVIGTQGDALEPDAGSKECCEDNGGCINESRCDGCAGVWEKDDSDKYQCSVKPEKADG